MEAPRWRLQEPHYLNVPGTEYDYKEMNQTTRKQVRKVFPVPLLLDPKEPTDWNYPDEIIVAHEVEGAHNIPRDIIFVGPPTLSMEPLNQAAVELSHKVLKTSKHPMDSLPANGSTEDILALLTKQLDAIVSKAGGYPKAENQVVPNDQLAAMQMQLNEALEKIARLEAKEAQGVHHEDNDPLAKVEITDLEEDKPVAPQAELSLQEHAQRAAAQVSGRRM